MPRIGMSEFCDVVTKTGPSKITAIAKIKNKPKYSPASDFYKKVRESIVTYHQEENVEPLDQVLISTTDATRLKHYSAVIAAYKKWSSAKSIEWFDPPSSKYAKHGFDITVNPELGLVIDGKPMVIKLYFSADDLPKAKCRMMNDLMAVALKGTLKNDVKCCILDIRNNKMIQGGSVSASFDTLVSAELGYIASVWESV